MVNLRAGMDNARKHIVIVEDADLQREAVAEYLTRAGFEVSQAASGAELRAVTRARSVDLAIVDLQLPDEDGFSIVRHLREAQRCGIIMLTANNDPTDRVVGLELGADDFLVKPHPPRELLARVRSVIRRLAEAAPATTPTAQSPLGAVGDWHLDGTRRCLVGPDGSSVDLTAAEYALVRELAGRPGEVLDRDHLMRVVFNRAWQYEDRSMDVLVTRLRRKLEPTGQAGRIKSVRGTGYVLSGQDLH